MTPEQESDVGWYVFHDASDAYFLLDPAELTVLEVNGTAQKLTERDRQELLGLDLPRLLGREGGKDLTELSAACRATVAAEVGGDFWLQTKSGVKLPVRVRAGLIPARPHAVAHLVVRDLSQQRKATEALAASEERFRALVENSSDAVTLTDAEGRILYASASVERIIGHSPGELVGHPGLEMVHPDDLAKAQAVLGQVLQIPGGQVPFALRVRHKDGSWRDAEGVCSNQLNNPAVGALVVNYRDVTVRRRFEAEIQYAQKLESLGVLAGGIAHDFNNLLTSILGFASLALMQLPPESPARDSVEQVEKASLRAAELIKQMLAYSGRGKLVVQLLNLSRLVEEMVSLLQTVISKKVLLRLGLAPELPPVEGDPTQLRQVVMNLITNASDALGEASGVIAVRTGVMFADPTYLRPVFLGQDLPPGEYVYVDVSDTGCGMDGKTLEKIFDPFYTTKRTGRGLGLAAVLGIVRGHRGALKVYSEVGKGTTFKVLFPRSQRGGLPATPREPLASPWIGSGTVLVVDDEDGVRELARSVLESTGFEVVLAENGREAVETFRGRRGEFVAVLLDLTMPDLNGEEAFRELRRLRSDVPTVLMSGYHEEEISSLFAGKGLAGFLHKPFQPADLIAVLREVLAPGRGEQDAPPSAQELGD